MNGKVDVNPPTRTQAPLQSRTTVAVRLLQLDYPSARASPLTIPVAINNPPPQQQQQPGKQLFAACNWV